MAKPETNKMQEYNIYESTPEMDKAIKGKTVSGVSYEWEYTNPFLLISFTDGTTLRIQYDWIYEWGLTGND